MPILRPTDEAGGATIIVAATTTMYFCAVSRKVKRVTALAEEFKHEKLDPYYAGFFKLFNRQKFYEAHEVLEHIWLKDKYGPDGAFYKGLIQLAGAFVHLQKDHLRPSAALFKLAQANLQKYPAIHHHLDIGVVLKLIANWLGRLEGQDFKINPLTASNSPGLLLLNH